MSTPYFDLGPGNELENIKKLSEIEDDISPFERGILSDIIIDKYNIGFVRNERHGVGSSFEQIRDARLRIQEIMDEGPLETILRNRVKTPPTWLVRFTQCIDCLFAKDWILQYHSWKIRREKRKKTLDMLRKKS